MITPEAVKQVAVLRVATSTERSADGRPPLLPSVAVGGFRRKWSLSSEMPW
jgi:hypothetical protein